MHKLPLSHMFIKTKWYHPIVTHDQRNQIAVKDIECTLYSLSAISTWMVYQTKSISIQYQDGNSGQRCVML
jgi:hypothetical protein